MRQIEITGAGGANGFVERTLADPVPGEGELRIRVKSSGVNFADTLVAKGLYPDAPPMPCVVGYEVSGVVDAVGSKVADGFVGKEVFALTRFKGYADTVVVPQNQVFTKPASLSHDQAAALPVQYLTAWQLLIVMGGLKAGETVLIHNAGGGVGLAALEIARQVGARTIGTASAQACVSEGARFGRSHRLRYGRLAPGTGPVDRWAWRRIDTRCAGRRPLEEKLRGLAAHWKTRHVRRFVGQ